MCWLEMLKVEDFPDPVMKDGTHSLFYSMFILQDIEANLSKVLSSQPNTPPSEALFLFLTT